jgi:hypothetical protein
MTRAEVRQWRRLLSEEGVLSYAADGRGDHVPFLADIVQQVRHPRALLRKAAR